ncbi:MAG: hypothetical protein AB2598_02585 [Candidatus Thiodiazotropha sp.]
MREKLPGSAAEWLMLEGLIGADGQFSPLSGRIQQRLRQESLKRSVPSKDYSLLLLDAGGDILLEVAALIRSPTICHEFAPAHQLLSGSMPLLPGAASLAIRRQGRDIYRNPIEQAPKLSVTWPKGRLQRGKRYDLGLKLTTPGNTDEALLIMAIHWGEGRYRIIGVSEPVERLSFDPAGLPGGKSCRLSITYQNGFRGTTLFSPQLSLKPLPPNLRMLRPRKDASFAAGAPISLLAEVDDPQGDRGLSSALRWSLDGNAVGCGPQALLTGLAEGEHTLMLAIEDHKQPTIERKIQIVTPPPLE